MLALDANVLKMQAGKAAPWKCLGEEGRQQGKFIVFYNLQDIIAPSFLSAIRL